MTDAIVPRKNAAVEPDRPVVRGNERPPAAI